MRVGLDFQKMLELRRAAGVKRWHTWPVLREQTLAAHSHGVAMLVWQVYPQASAALLMAALAHDLAEVSTGDVPAHVKWANPELTTLLEVMEQKWLVDTGLDFQLTELEHTVLHFCDSFELLIFALEDFRLGNQNMLEVIPIIIGRLFPIRDVTDMTRVMFMDVKAYAINVTGAEQ